jgi:hypothetical protein
MMNPSKRIRLLLLTFAVVLAAGLFFSEAIGDYFLAPLLNGAWRVMRWFYNLPLVIWWFFLVLLFSYLGLSSFLGTWERRKQGSRTGERFKSAAWVQGWLMPIRQSSGGPFIRDAMMSFRRLAVHMLAQRENYTPREYTRLLTDGQCRLPDEVSALLESLEKLDEQRAYRQPGRLSRAILRLQARFEGSPDLLISLGPQQPSQHLPALKKAAREQIETYIQFMENELEIHHHDHAAH